jgi:hypothetical protein
MKKTTIWACLALSLTVASVSLVPQRVEAQDIKTYLKIDKPAAGSTVVLVTPDVSLGLLTAGGVTEPKSDWSKSAQGFLAAALTKTLTSKKYKVSEVSPDSYEDPHALQILKLNNEVISAIAAAPYTKLPTKTTFDWTLGDGVQTLANSGLAEGAEAPRYALFVRCTGSYQSAAKAAMNVGMALIGGGMQFGGQFIQASMVDLKSGQVVWYELKAVASGTDIRTSEGALSAVESLAKNLPL